MPSARKTALLEKVLRTLGEHYELVPMGEHARRIRARGSLPLRAVA
jgi:hypothetical protein